MPCDLPVSWHWVGRSRRTRVGDLSRGGAFILSEVHPEVGEAVTVAIEGEDTGRLEFEARVSWIRPAGSDPGFGVAFRLQSREAAAALQALVRAQETVQLPS